ncbi:hypothetical protein ACFOWX_12420 [Sphingorhabdus arenilitoris]|uniref:GNAT family N-acetyltransferase n=1 Tax=Sphingorhabdus arenilitoris TaxID=1490041 RepID=A0ABV8RLS0_9SPHN
MSDFETVSSGDAEAKFYRRSPAWQDTKTAAVGGIKFGSSQAGSALLEQICIAAKAEGFEALLGPLDGDTWHSYRLVFDSDGSPPFMMEPVSGAHDLTAFTAAGFAPVSHYMSAKARLTDTLGDTPVPVPTGIHIEAWDGQDGEKLIRYLFEMSTGSFAQNLFFTPIDFESFLGIYTPLLPFINKDHVLFARDTAGDIQGFLFGTPNYLAQGDEKSCILKTYASAIPGIGHLLADSYHRRAIDMGFTHVIHALMHEDNKSRWASEKHRAHIFRRYALMGRKL